MGISATNLFSRLRPIRDSGERVPLCSSCGRIRVDTVWLAAPPAVRAALEETDTFTHSLCERCAEAVLNEEPR
jgi:hypothetical protein